MNKILIGLEEALEVARGNMEPGRITTIEIDRTDQTECALVRLQGAATRLLMILEHRSERNYETAMGAVERAMAEYRAIPRS
jgi:hypothetical protein